MSDASEVIFEPFQGGRIFERAPDGTEFDWGEIVAWEPPLRFRCLWHLFFDRAEATDLEVTFQPAPAGTKIVIRQTGWERLGKDRTERRSRTQLAWSSIAGEYRTYVEASA